MAPSLFLNPKLDYLSEVFFEFRMKCDLCSENIDFNKVKGHIGIICNCSKICDFCVVKIYVLDNHSPITRVSSCALCTTQISLEASQRLLDFTIDHFSTEGPSETFYI